MNEELRKVALFFYLCLLDERRTLDCAARVLRRCQPHCNAFQLVRSLNRVWVKTSWSKVRPQDLTFDHFELPLDLDLTAWTHFRNQASKDEIFAFILNRVLGVSTSDISLGLGLSQGTVQFRINHALTKLGRHLEGAN